MSTITRISCLKKMVALEEQRETLAQRLQLLDQRLRELRTMMPPKTPPKLKRPPNPNRKGRGELRRQILDALEAAGSQGVRAQDIARQAGVKAPHIHAWFSMYMKRLPGLVRVSPGCYVLTEADKKNSKKK